DVYNVESLRTEPELSAESKLKLMRLRVRMVYDAGRERDVKDFVEQAKLLEYLKGVGNSREAMIQFAHYEAMIQFAHYVEALVAYHRYLGGRDN
ncbi:MAG: type III-A CRISPR-associated protein Csm2, partial [Candidatus Limiplasma sp.]|nr:type III-A CRISPR-associated protein Csm2 [Candidatus Limiplasma sp.]